MPLVVTDSAGNVSTAANLPRALRDLPYDDPRIRAFAARLDRANPPLYDSIMGQRVHYGPMPAQRQLTGLAILQALTLAVMVAVAIFAYRSAINAQRDRLWVAMAREAAHQMGTPLTSLHGWIERVRWRSEPPADLADHLPAAAERLGRVARGPGRIRNPAQCDPAG